MLVQKEKTQLLQLFNRIVLLVNTMCGMTEGGMWLSGILGAGTTFTEKLHTFVCR